MKAALWLVGLFGVAVASALLAGGNQSTVTVFWAPHRIDVSLNLALLVLLGLLLGAAWSPTAAAALLLLMSSLLLSATYLPKPSQRNAPVEEAPVESQARKQLIPNADLIESRPEVKETILRLHQSLDKI